MITTILVVAIPVVITASSPTYIAIAAVGVVIAMTQPTLMGKILKINIASTNTPIVSVEVGLCSTYRDYWDPCFKSIGIVVKQFKPKSREA